MKNPTPKKEIAILELFKEERVIQIYATADTIEDLKGFGRITSLNETRPNQYHLWVDTRYGLDEVIKYIEEYN